MHLIESPSRQPVFKTLAYETRANADLELIDQLVDMVLLFH